MTYRCVCISVTKLCNNIFKHQRLYLLSLLC